MLSSKYYQNNFIGGGNKGKKILNKRKEKIIEKGENIWHFYCDVL